MTRVALPSGKPATTRPSHLDLVDRRVPPNAVEAPYVVRHGGWYYLFASFDFCCQGRPPLPRFRARHTTTNSAMPHAMAMAAWPTAPHPAPPP